jgi:hypothetical protein
MQTGSFQAVAMTGINLVLILKIGFQTLLTPALLLGAFAGAMLLAWALTQGRLKTKSLFRHYFHLFCLAPFLLNLLLLINYTFSRQPVQETYLFSQEWQETRQGMQKSTLIELQGNAYAAYPGIRVFWSYSALEGYDQVTYTFQKGLFGLRVMTDYSFRIREE